MRNFIELAKRWFKEDLSDYNLFLMPIGFLPTGTVAAIVRVPGEEKKLLAYLGSVAEKQGENSTFHTLLDVQVAVKRTKREDAALAVRINKNDPDAMSITLTEEQIRATYPWDYAELTDRLKARYANFKANQDYHDVRRPLEADERFARVRYLDPGNPKSTKKKFYNPNILAEFDKRYTLRAS